MKKRIFAALLSLCMVLMCLPALADDAAKGFNVTAIYTTTVKQGGSAKPGKTDFTLKLMKYDGTAAELGDVKVSGRTVTTDGEGAYNTTLTFLVPFDSANALSDGIFVQQKNDGKDGWTYDDTVWCVMWKPIIEFSLDDEAPANVEYQLEIYPTHKEDGVYQRDDDRPMEKMIFTDVYTKSETVTPAPVQTPVPDISSLPQTGDGSNLAAWIALLAGAAAGMAGVIVWRRKSARGK